MIGYARYFFSLYTGGLCVSSDGAICWAYFNRYLAINGGGSLLLFAVLYMVEATR